MNSVLPPGIHMWLWPKSGWPDASKLASDLLSLGVTGVIPQAGLGAADWCSRNERVLDSAGLHVTCGLGLDGAHTSHEIVDAIVGGIDRVGTVMLDWELPKLWESAGGNKLAAEIVDDVLALRPDASRHVTDCPWWAPLRLPDTRPTHPHAPTRTFGALASLDRYVQAYGAPVPGRSADMLAWARHSSQYASLGSWQIRPSHQAYARTVTDHVETLLAEETVCLWDYVEMDPACRTGLRAVKRLRELGCATVQQFQATAGLVVDGDVGPKTLAALGIV